MLIKEGYEGNFDNEGLNDRATHVEKMKSMHGAAGHQKQVRQQQDTVSDARVEQE
jgi:hypothetical protein